MITYEDLEYIVDGDISGDVFGPWINTAAVEEGVFHYWGLSFNDANGKHPYVYFEGTNDPARGEVYHMASMGGLEKVSLENFSSRLAFGSANQAEPLPKWIRIASYAADHLPVGGLTVTGTLSMAFVGRANHGRA